MTLRAIALSFPILSPAQVLGVSVLLVAGMYGLPRAWAWFSIKREIRNMRSTYTDDQRRTLDALVNPKRTK